MRLYQTNKERLSLLREETFKLEKDIQKIIEDNLFALFGLELVKSEFTIKNKRIDTLAFDAQTSGFVIIEYKRDRNISVIDQGFGYLSLMLENKAEFIVEYTESLGKKLKREDVDWSQSRVVFVAPTFTENQRLATNFKDAAIELWEVRKYEHNIISVNQIRKTSNQSIKQLADRGGEFEEVSKEIKVYTEDEHLAKSDDEIKETYEHIKDRLLALGDLEITPSKVYLSFKLNGKGITDFSFVKKAIWQRLNLRKGVLDDPKGLFQDVSEKGHWGSGDYEAKYDENIDIDYLMSLVRQSYEYHKKNG